MKSSKRLLMSFKGDCIIGAGTVQTYDELVQAIAAGAVFVLSPRKMNQKMLDYCKQHNVIAVPGLLHHPKSQNLWKWELIS